MDNANFINLAGRLVRDAIARGVLNAETGGAFMEEAHRLSRIGAVPAFKLMEIDGVAREIFQSTPTYSEPTPIALSWETTKFSEEAMGGDAKSARANALAKRMRGTDDEI